MQMRYDYKDTRPLCTNKDCSKKQIDLVHKICAPCWLIRYGLPQSKD
jgi:hypothetical protein